MMNASTRTPENDNLENKIFVRLGRKTDEFEAYQHGHAERIAALADELGKIFGLANKDRQSLRAAALLHDLGEATMNREYIKRPGCFVWVAVKDPEPQEMAALQAEFKLHALAVEDATLVGNKLICTVGTEGCAAVAFHRDTGKEVWRALSTEEIGCAPPTLIEAGGAKQVIIWLSESVNSVNPDTGKAYWSIPDPEDGKPDRPAVNIITPTRVGKDRLFVSSFYHGSLMIQLAVDRDPAK